MWQGKAPAALLVPRWPSLPTLPSRPGGRLPWDAPRLVRASLWFFRPLHRVPRNRQALQETTQLVRSITLSYLCGVCTALSATLGPLEDVLRGVGGALGRPAPTSVAGLVDVAALAAVQMVAGVAREDVLMEVTYRMQRALQTDLDALRTRGVLPATLCPPGAAPNSGAEVFPLVPVCLAEALDMASLLAALVSSDALSADPGDVGAGRRNSRWLEPALGILGPLVFSACAAVHGLSQQWSLIGECGRGGERGSTVNVGPGGGGATGPMPRVASSQASSVPLAAAQATGLVSLAPITDVDDSGLSPKEGRRVLSPSGGFSVGERRRETAPAGPAGGTVHWPWRSSSSKAHQDPRAPADAVSGPRGDHFTSAVLGNVVDAGQGGQGFAPWPGSPSSAAARGTSQPATSHAHFRHAVSRQASRTLIMLAAPQRQRLAVYSGVAELYRRLQPLQGLLSAAASAALAPVPGRFAGPSSLCAGPAGPSLQSGTVGHAPLPSSGMLMSPVAVLAGTRGRLPPLPSLKPLSGVSHSAAPGAPSDVGGLGAAPPALAGPTPLRPLPVLKAVSHTAPACAEAAAELLDTALAALQSMVESMVQPLLLHILPDVTQQQWRHFQPFFKGKRVTYGIQVRRLSCF